MVGHVEPAGSGSPASAGGSARRPRWHRRTLLAVLGLVIFFMGVACGGRVDSTDAAAEGVTAPSAGAEVEAEAEKEKETANETEKELAEREAELDRVAAEVAARADALDDLRARLDAHQARLDARKQKLDDRTANLSQRRAALDEREDRLDAQAQDLAAADAQDDAGSGQSVYYGNCSEARAAGAAPLYVGDPGYAGHLDGDGDGVACES